MLNISPPARMPVMARIAAPIEKDAIRRPSLDIHMPFGDLCLAAMTW